MTTMSSKSDLALWARAAGGDASAVEAVMELAGKIARERSYGYSGHDVDDLTSRLRQVVMTRLRNKEVNVVRRNLRGWLGAWLCSVRKDLNRQRRRHRTEALDDQTAGHGPDPSHGAELDEMQSALDECLSKLPKNHRDAVIARHGQNSSIAASAPALGNCNPTTLRVWVMRGLLSLRECMKHRGFAHI